MKNSVFIILLIVILGGISYFIFLKKDSPSRVKDTRPLAVGKQTGSFTESFELLLQSYYALKDALVASDTLKANKAAQALLIASDSLKVDEIKGDTSNLIKETARSFTGTISGSAMGFIGEQNIEEKRKEFEIISDALWSLTRTIRYGGAKVYYQFCPMAFDNRGAYWLSNTTEIRNPYFGEKMPECGSTEDSVDYSKK